ncbi:MAG: hypothetical protein AB8C84_08140 [Oligoflexales bacterium]
MNIWPQKTKTHNDFLKDLSKNSSSIPLPSAIISEEIFEENLDFCCEHANKFNKKIRIASKSIRIPLLLEKALQRPEVIGIMSYDPWETLKLVENGFQNILLAYPLHSQKAMEAIIQCYEKGVKVIVMIDDPEGMRAYQKWWTLEESLHICFDIDISIRKKILNHTIHLGVRRSPAHALIGFKNLLKELKKYKKLELKGVMTYDAHIAGLTDFNKNQKTKSLALGLFKIYAKKHAKEIRDLIKNESPCRNDNFIHNGGGTGSLIQSLKDTSINEITIGSGLLQPHLFDRYRHRWGKPAVFCGVTATRTPSSGIITCQGGGYTASGAIGEDRTPVVAYPCHLRPLKQEGFGEVQTPLFDKNNSVKKGESILLRPAKSGEFLQSSPRIYLFSKEKIFKKTTCLLF